MINGDGTYRQSRESPVNDLKILLFPSYLYHLYRNYEYHMTMIKMNEIIMVTKVACKDLIINSMTVDFLQEDIKLQEWYKKRLLQFSQEN